MQRTRQSRFADTRFNQSTGPASLSPESIKKSFSTVITTTHPLIIHERLRYGATCSQKEGELFAKHIIHSGRTRARFLLKSLSITESISDFSITTDSSFDGRGKIMRWIDDRTMSRRTRSRIYERDVFDLWDGVLR